MEWKEVKVMVEGGKASAGPPLGSTLGPLGLNVANIVKDINAKTKDMAGMQVPAIVLYDPASKKYEIRIGTPPASALIKKEARIEKGAAKPNEMIADLKIEQVIKVAKIKEGGLPGRSLKERVKQIAGTCDSMGVMIEGKRARESIVDIAAGKFDEEIRAEKTEITAEELKALEEEKKRLKAEIEARRQEFETRAKAIFDAMQGQEKPAIKAKMHEEGIPEEFIQALLGEREAAAAAGAPAKGEAKGKPAPKEQTKGKDQPKKT